MDDIIPGYTEADHLAYLIDPLPFMRSDHLHPGARFWRMRRARALTLARRVLDAGYVLPDEARK